MDGKPLQFYLGHSRVDITPPLGVPMGGYAFRKDNGCDEIESPLFADALLLQQGEDQILLMTTDLVMIFEFWGAEVREKVSKATGIPASNVVITATHTHFGPATNRKEQALHQTWLATVVERMVAAAEKATNNLKPVNIKVGSGDFSPIAFNRRPVRTDGTCVTTYTLPPSEDGLTFRGIDPKQTVLVFEDAEGELALLLVSTPMHAVVGGDNAYAISADYPGELKSALEQTYQVPALFVAGTAGNVVPFKRGPGLRKLIGRYLAGLAMQSTELATDCSGRFGLVQKRLALDPNQRQESQEKIPFEITAVSLGQLGLVFLPGEILAETGLHIQARSPFPYTGVISLANQAPGYLATRSAFWEGGYEGTVSRFAEDSEAIVVDEATRLLYQVWESTRQVKKDSVTE